MARNAAYRWQNERKRGLVGPTSNKPKKRRKPAGITNKQARYLAALQKRLGVPYTGNGMTKAEAHRAINEAKRRLKGATPVSAGATRTLSMSTGQPNG